jgi:hypothetical protein
MKPSLLTMRVITLPTIFAMAFFGICGVSPAQEGNRLTAKVQTPEDKLRASEEIRKNQQGVGVAVISAVTPLAPSDASLAPGMMLTAGALADPSIAYNLRVINTTVDLGEYAITLEFPIQPPMANSTWGELIVELIDSSGDGQASLFGSYGDTGAIQSAFVYDSNTSIGESVGPPLGSELTAPGVQTFVLSPFAGPTPPNVDTFNLSAFFTLSPGDTAHLTGRFIIDEGTGIPFAEIPPLPDLAEAPFFTVIDAPPTVIGDDDFIDSFTQLNVRDGGSVGFSFEAGHFSGDSTFVEVNISGGAVGGSFDAWGGSVVNVSGGTVGQNLKAFEGSVVNIFGGVVGVGVRVSDGAVMNISGGSVNQGVGSTFTVLGGVVNISGGTLNNGGVSNGFQVFDGSVVTVYGSAFLLDGQPISGLVPGEPLLVAERDVTLSGMLADGSPFSFELNSVEDFTGDFFDPDATLLVALPLPGDFDGNGAVEDADLARWRAGLGQFDGAATLAAPRNGDADGDHDVDGVDFLVWQQNLGQAIAFELAAAVPEPSSVALAFTAIGLARIVRRREVF